MNFTKTIVNALKHWTTDKLNKKVDKEDFIALKNAKPDWNQNDSSADDYIKNRPFYTDDNGKVIKLDKKFIDLPDGIITEDDLAPVATSGSYNDLTDIPETYSDVVRYSTSQSLTTAQKTTGKANIGAVGYDAAQSLTDAQKTQARANIGAADEVKVEELISSAKNGILLTDETSGYSYVVSIKDGNLVTYCTAKSIEVIVQPTKIEYMTGDYFDPTGMVVIAMCYDGTTREITDIVYPTNYLTEEMTSVEISYIERGISFSVSVPVTVAPFDPAVQLIDFNYTANSDGTYTLTGWKGTYNGEASTEIIVPNNGLIRV